MSRRRAGDSVFGLRISFGYRPSGLRVLAEPDRAHQVSAPYASGSERMRFSQSFVPSNTARIIFLRNTGSSIFASSSGLDMNACSTSIDGIQVFARSG